MKITKEIKEKMLNAIFDITNVDRPTAPPTIDRNNRDYKIKEITGVKLTGDKVTSVLLGAELDYIRLQDQGFMSYYAIYRNGTLSEYVTGNIKKIIKEKAIETCQLTTGNSKYAGRKFCNLTYWQKRCAVSYAKHY